MYKSINLIAGLVGLVLTGPAQGADLVARYILDGTADDSSGNDFHGVNTAATFVDDPDRGTVASFNGTSSSIDVSASAYSITERPNFQCAISFWFKPTARDDYKPGGATDLNPIMGAIGSGVIEVVGDHSWHGMGGSAAYGGIGLNSGGGAGSVGKIDAIDVYDGAWHHVVIQWADPDGVPSDPGLNTGADATVYIDNQLADDANPQTYNGNSGQANPTMVLGGPLVWSDGGAADKYYLGLLSDVQFFDDQLTAGEVSDLFTQGSIVPPGLVLDIASNGTNLDFTWDSKSGKVYDLLSATDLTTTPGTWTPWKTDIPATPPTNTESYLRPADPETFFVLVEKPAPPLLSEDFEAGAGGFTAVNHTTGTIWALGDPASSGEGGTIDTGNGGSANCWGTDIGSPGIYATGTDTSLISPVIDLTGVAGATLSFAQAIDIFAGDTLVVNIIDDTTDTVIEPAIHTSTPDGDIGAANWETVDSIAIGGTALGQMVRIEWRFTGTNDGTYLGAYLDDVVVSVP